MYARVPDELRPALIQNLKRKRLKSAIIQYPICLLIFSAGLTAIIWIKGHFLLELLEEIIREKVSHTQFVAGVIGLIAIVTAISLIYLLKENYLQCRCHAYHFCPDCITVDNYDEGNCHVCGKLLTEKADFFYTTDKDEIASIKRIGLPVFKETRHVTVQDQET